MIGGGVVVVFAALALGQVDAGTAANNPYPSLNDPEPIVAAGAPDAGTPPAGGEATGAADAGVTATATPDGGVSGGTATATGTATGTTTPGTPAHPGHHVRRPPPPTEKVRVEDPNNISINALNAFLGIYAL